MKRVFISFAAVALLAGAAAACPPGMDCEHHGKGPHHGMHGGGGPGPMGKGMGPGMKMRRGMRMMMGGGGGFGFHGMAAGRAHGMLARIRELKLTEAQVEKIHSLKLAAEKERIRAQAELETIGVDLRAEMHSPNRDASKIKSLIGKKFDQKKAMAQSAVDFWTKLEGVLTDEQRGKLREMRGPRWGRDWDGEDEEDEDDGE